MDSEEAIAEWINSSLFVRDADFFLEGFESTVVVCRVKLWGKNLATFVGEVDGGVFNALEGRHRYCEVIRVVANMSKEEPTYLFYTTDPEGCFRLLKWVGAYSYEWGLDAIATQFVTEEDNGAYLGIIPRSRLWMLLHEFVEDEELSIIFLGPRSMCVELARVFNSSIA